MVELAEKLYEILKEPCEREGFKLIDVSLSQGKSCIVTVFVDREGGIRLSELSELDALIEANITASGLIEDSYTLSVSSPGLNRELKKDRDFENFIGRLVILNTLKGKFKGELVSYKEGIVEVCTQAGNVYIPKSDIKKAKLYFDIKESLKKGRI